MPETLLLLAGKRSDGSPVHEELLVEPLGSGRYRLLRSPGLVLGVAADDVFERGKDEQPVVTHRGRNLCIQIYFGADDPRLERALSERLGALGGRRDGKSRRQLVYTVPVAAGFGPVEEVLRGVVREFPQAEWYYGNVYDPIDGVTPLNWW